jgi:vacuolar-type H+-ATPase subunit H
MLVLTLALPATWGDDKKEDKPPPTAREQYDALVKDFTAKQREISAQFQKVKGEEQQKLIQQYRGLGKDFADKFYKLAEDNAKDPVAADALIWVVQYGAGSPEHPKATEKVNSLIAEMPLKDLKGKLSRLPGVPATTDAVLKRAVKEEKDPDAAELLSWAATTSYPPNQKAIDLLIEKYPDHAAIERICMVLGRGNSPKAADTLKLILETSTKPKVRAAAAVGLGRSLAAKTDSLGDNLAESDKVAAEAEKYLSQAITLYRNVNGVPATDVERKALETQVTGIEREIKALRTLRVGKVVPEIAGGDLDGKEFKLSDYRGKVVLLDFWGFW